MIQTATGASGTGYAIRYTRPGPTEAMKAKAAEIMALQNKAGNEAKAKAIAAEYHDLEAEWAKTADKTVAHLIVDGTFQGEFPNGAAARDAAFNTELQIGNSLGELTWRTEA